ncbi:P-type conjugative transfer protein TrbL [Pseudomonas sp. RIT-PI-S]|uniref:P-type conjugative transfer protein TrbL n=1 Tax=Pseudomonas sp. RIT-PI-S TaxID=3035295 RepID=UPI0021D7DA77|nr:P-type conjugative transfer protein TrbL [Pseudomonas sp. RIT-PI-S]
MKRHFLTYITLISLPFSQSAYAAGLDSGDMLNKILESFSTVAATWQSEVTSSASWLFWGLAIISMTWTYGLMALRNADIGDFFGETIRFFGTLGLFWWLLKNGPAISLSIIDTLRTISARASGLGSGLSPSSIVDIGFSILTKVSSSASLLSPVVSALMIAAAIVVLVILALIAVNMLLLLVSAWLLAYAGIFLLGFGGSRWTSDIAINFYKTVLGIGVQLFTMTFLVGVGKSFLDQYYKAFEAGTPDLNSLCVLLVASVVLLMLVNRLPPMLAGIIGSTGQSSGIGSFGAGAAIGAATMAASAAASAGSAALAGVNELAGGTSALSAAFKAAQASAEASGTATGNVDNYQSTQNSHGQSAFGQAIGSGTVEGSGYASRVASAGRLAANAASLVANQIGQKIGNQASAAIADTAGGRLATAIDVSSKAPKTGDAPVVDSHNMTNEADEISEFINKKPPQD